MKHELKLKQGAEEGSLELLRQKAEIYYEIWKWNFDMNDKQG